ncbi:MAG: thiamine/thiamine pyrophosphate ABC transporter, permease protein [Rhizobiaceae bacterium]|nr:thiamine/thiamine pyrophosphate ABC transporter, permease protein [Rhizobiaceae bacterium]
MGNPDAGWKLAAGLAALALLAVFVLGAFAVLLALAGTRPDAGALLADPYLRSVVVFTLQQASLSAALSIAGAIPLALALHRARFRGREAILRLCLMPQALPVLVGALAIVAVWGRSGIVSDGLAALGLPRLDVYGLTGILIAHVFFNLPLATRLLVAALDAVPAERWKLAAGLSFGVRATFRTIEWPALRGALPGAASLVFMLCITSFTLVLVLGGGPGATTLEVAIYQALRYDFSPGRAALLGLAQIALTALVLFALFRFGGTLDGAATLGQRAVRYDRPSRGARLASSATLVLGLGFIAAPFAAILLRGLDADLLRLVGETTVQRAAVTSAVLAVASATLSLLLSTALLFGSAALGAGSNGDRRAFGSPFDLAGSLVLVVPPIVLGAGWFLALRGTGDVFAAAPVMVAVTNAVMAMPFVMRIIGPPMAQAALRHDRLAASLALSGLSRLRHVDWPALKYPVRLALAFAMALSLGDLGAAALFGNQDFVTLPLLLHQRMGSYRTADAAGLALLLGALSLALMAMAERGTGRPEAQT